MKTRLWLVIAVAFTCATTLYAHNYQGYQNVIGDWNVLTLGGYTIANPISVDLAPTNAPDASAQYSIRCQLIYRDNRIPRPRSDNELKIVLGTGNVLNEWLRDFIANEYAGSDYDDLFEKYKNCMLAEDLNARFPEYIAEQILKIEDPLARPDVDTVTVTVSAEGAFRDDLIREAEKENNFQEQE